jgi:hypothetical protein
MTSDTQHAIQDDDDLYSEDEIMKASKQQKRHDSRRRLDDYLYELNLKKQLEDIFQDLS